MDRINDYVRYEIVPPAELQEEYFRLTENIKKEKVNQKKEALTESIEMLAKIKVWYKKDFSGEVKKEKAKKENVKISVIAGKGKITAENIERQAAIIDQRIMAIESVTMYSINNIGNTGYDETITANNFSSGSGSYNAIDQRSEVGDSAIINNGNASVGNKFSKAETDMRINNPKTNKDGSKIKVKAWSPDEAYLKELENTPKDQGMGKYFELKKEYYDQPSFYIDVADYMMKNGMSAEALQVLSNVSEMKLESPELLKTYGYKLLELNKPAEAVEVFRELVKIKGEDPQSYRDLAMAYERNRNYQEALDTYYVVLSRRWDGRFTQVKDVVLKEMNRLIALHPRLDISKINKRLIYSMPLDVRVTLEWTADNSDIDLHFIDPFGEEGYYGRNLTEIGSRLSGDITQGFGPEEFALKKALDGTYVVRVKYFGDSRQNLAGPVTLRVVMYTNYGTKKEKAEEILVRVKGKKEMLEIGELIFKN